MRIEQDSEIELEDPCDDAQNVLLIWKNTKAPENVELDCVCV